MLMIVTHISRIDKFVFHSSAWCVLQVKVRISGSTEKQQHEKGPHWRSRFHHSHCRLYLLAAWGRRHSGKVLNRDILQHGQDASVVQGNGFTASQISE